MKIKITKVGFEDKQKEFDLPFPLYLEEGKPIKPEALINMISKYEWPKEKQEEYKTLCEMLRALNKGITAEDETDESSRQIF